MHSDWSGAVLLETERLRLRLFREDDLPLFVALNADPDTMRWLGGPMAEADALAWAADLQARPGQGRLGMMPIERRADGAFLGTAGLNRLDWYPDDVEVGWRLLPAHRGQGYATEAGRAWIDHAFRALPVDRVISVADLPNAPSQAVMRRLGMRLDHEATLVHKGESFDAAVFAVSRADWAR